MTHKFFYINSKQIVHLEQMCRAWIDNDKIFRKESQRDFVYPILWYGSAEYGEPLWIWDWDNDWCNIYGGSTGYVNGKWLEKKGSESRLV